VVPRLGRLASLAGLYLLCGLAFTVPQKAAAGDARIIQLASRMPARAPALRTMRQDGPRILIHQPRSFRLSSPVDFDVEVVPRNGVRPDMSTLKVEYDAGLVWADVTSRIKRRASMQGLRLRARGTELPAGRHVLRLTIRDKRGRATVAELTLLVSD